MIDESDPFWKPYMVHCRLSLLVRLWKRRGGPELRMKSLFGFKVLLTKTPYGSIVITQDRV